MGATRVYVEETGRRIEPFLDPIGDTPICFRPLREWQADAFRDAGLVRVDAPEPPCLVVPDTLFTTGGALRQFLDGAAGRDAVLVLKRSRHGKATVPVQPDVTEVDGGWRFEKIRFVCGDGAEPAEVVVDPEEDHLDLPMPKYLGAVNAEIGIPRHPVMTLHHWVHILWANHLPGQIEMRNTPKWRFGLRLTWAVLRAFSFNKWKVMGKLNRVGRNCDIHPTAVVEASTLGDNVKIGPHARVVLSTLDDDVDVMTGAQVDLCVLGKGSCVSEASTLRFSVLYPGAFVGQYLMQQCVLGRDCMTTGGAYSIDLNFDQDIRVPLDGVLHSTGTRFLGSAFGHDSRIGTGFWLASGRMVPNGAFIVRDPGAVLQRVPPQVPTDRPLVVDGTRLRWDE